ncbi:MAG: hypothetical protein QOD03_287 [Verrucomicrobiota bacterium]|jgi:hypothetical protein
MKTKFIVVFALMGLFVASPSFAKDKAADSWSETLVSPEETFTNIGRNPCFILEPGYQLVLAGTEEGKKTEVTITVLNETQDIAGVTTRVIEERETADGKLVEVSRNYYVIGTKSHHAYYFGEDVDMYKDGKVASHEGTWREGKDGAKHGVMISGEMKAGERYYQEKAPGIAQDRGENISANQNVKTPGGTFKDCVKVKETTPLEPDNVETKFYAPGIGLVSDGNLKLIKHGFAK